MTLLKITRLREGKEINNPGLVFLLLSDCAEPASAGGDEPSPALAARLAGRWDASLHPAARRAGAGRSARPSRCRRDACGSRPLASGHRLSAPRREGWLAHAPVTMPEKTRR